MLNLTEQYHMLAGMSKSKTEFVQAVKLWWKSEYTTAPPVSQYLYIWYNTHGY